MSDTPMAGYIVGAVRSAEAPPSKEMVEEFMAIGASLPADFGFAKIFLGPALKMSEMAEGCPNTSIVFKFATKAKAVEFYEGAEYKEWSSKYGIGTKIKRDMRIIEAPAELFVAGKAYWVALLYQVHDTERFGAYFEAFVAANTKGFTVPLEDGTVAENAVLEIKWAGPSDFKEEALTMVPAAGNGKPFLPGTMTDQGLVLIGEMPSHAIGKAFKGCVEYKNTMLAPFKKTYTDEATYEADVKTFMAEIFTRDVRIIGV